MHCRWHAPPHAQHLFQVHIECANATIAATTITTTVIIITTLHFPSSTELLRIWAGREIPRHQPADS